MVIDFFLRVGRSFAKQGLGDIAVAAIDPTLLSAGNLLGKVAVDIWKDYRLDKKQNQLHQDILAAAKLTFEEAKQAGIEAAKLATDDPELQGQIERLVTLIPASIRASLRRAEDPTGTTLPANFAVHDAEDLVKLFPVRLPRFKAGDTPVFLRGWRLVEQVGAGGFGEVWKVQSTRASNLLGAVKLSHGLSETEQSLLNENDLLNRLLAEGELDGIVPLHDVWAEGDPVPWLRYKYIAGGDLTALIHRWQGLAPASRYEAAVDGLLQLAGTVGHFHNLTNAEGKPDPIVHRDLKPSNILCDGNKLKVADLGIGAISSRRSLGGDTSRGMSQGAVLASYLRGSHTPLYASPQQRAGSRAIDPRDDVHALGVIAYQMITGRLDAAPGFDAEYDLRAKGASDQLIELIKQCTSHDPKRRLPNANAMHAKLHELRTPKVAVSREVDPIELQVVPPDPIPVANKLAQHDTEAYTWKGERRTRTVRTLKCGTATMEFVKVPAG